MSLRLLLGQFFRVRQLLPLVLVIRPRIPETTRGSQLLQSSRHFLSPQPDEFHLGEAHSRLKELAYQRPRREREVGGRQLGRILLL